MTDVFDQLVNGACSHAPFLIHESESEDVMNIAVLRFGLVAVLALSLFSINNIAAAQTQSGCSDSSCGVNFEYTPQGGPGTEMTKIINRLGLGSDCGRCKSLAARMDQGGPEWVKQNFEYVVSQTISNAERLGHQMGPVRKAGVRAIVRESIRRARFKQFFR